jgi:hypothetical protein
LFRKVEGTIKPVFTVAVLNHLPLNQMILTIHINKEVRGVYLARAYLGSTEVSEAETYQGIEAAIRGEALRAQGGADFLVFTYGGMSTGTFLVREVTAKATDLAHRLVYLNAQMHEIERLRNAGGV